jgi:hypothetical protein
MASLVTIIATLVKKPLSFGSFSKQRGNIDAGIFRCWNIIFAGLEYYSCVVVNARQASIKPVAFNPSTRLGLWIN